LTTRYGREVEKRVQEIAAEVNDEKELLVPAAHPEHPQGECVECDARRWLRIFVLQGRESLEQTRCRFDVSD
jgi:hypothetical protein